MNILYCIAGERIENGDVVCLNTETGLLFKATREDVKSVRKDGKNCCNCTYYCSQGKFAEVGNETLIEKGRCQKNAPREDEWWPLVRHDDFCGEFKD
jgi:hypothetical protein